MPTVSPPQVNKQHSELVFDHLHATAFQHSPLGRTILGPVENIKSINRDQLVQYIKTHYRGPRMVRGTFSGHGFTRALMSQTTMMQVLAAAGAVNHDELVKLATDAFGSIPDEDPTTSVRALLTKEPALYTGSYVHDRFPDATNCSFAVAFRGASWTDPDSIPLMVMQTMLGEGGTISGTI